MSEFVGDTNSTHFHHIFNSGIAAGLLRLLLLLLALLAHKPLRQVHPVTALGTHPGQIPGIRAARLIIRRYRQRV